MQTVRVAQLRMRAFGFDPGAIDGVVGPNTLRAWHAMIDSYGTLREEDDADGDVSVAAVVPETWMPPAAMRRIIFHWTAGVHSASSADLRHYHILIEGDGGLKKGQFPISANQRPRPGRYAAHTLNCNTGSIGVAVCAMAGAVERPFSPGPKPMTEAQIETLIPVLTDLCMAYDIAPERDHVLSHAEVQETLGIRQNRKWDIANTGLPGWPVGAHAIGDRIRARVWAHLGQRAAA